MLVPLLVAASGAAGGELDPSFSGDGWTRTIQIGEHLPQGASDVEVLPDGRILAAVTVDEQIGGGFVLGVVRYRADGELDTTFADGGVATSPTGPFGSAHALEVQPDGRILVAGVYACPERLCMVVVRFFEDGRLDSSFGAGGVAADAGPRPTSALDVAVQPDGKIVLAGDLLYGTRDAQDANVFAAVRFRPDGAVDGSFGRRGRVKVDFGFGNDAARAVEVTQDGRIVLAGVGTRNRYLHETDIALARLRRDGSLDRSFGRGGTATYGGSGPEGAADLALDGRGRLLVGAAVKQGGVTRAAILRLDPGGGLDRGFGSGGRALLAKGEALAVAVAADGSILAGGRTGDDWLLARLTSGGARDPSFSGDGVVVSSFGTGEDSLAGLALQADGKIVAAGEVGGAVGAARYLP